MTYWVELLFGAINFFLTFLIFTFFLSARFYLKKISIIKNTVEDVYYRKKPVSFSDLLDKMNESNNNDK